MVFVNVLEIELNFRWYVIWGKFKINVMVIEVGIGKVYIECKCILRNYNEWLISYLLDLF